MTSCLFNTVQKTLLICIRVQTLISCDAGQGCKPIYTAYFPTKPVPHQHINNNSNKSHLGLTFRDVLRRTRLY